VLSTTIRHAFARSSHRAVYSLIGGGLFFAWLVRCGIPWWVALPAGILCFVALFMLAVAALYAYTKLQYPARAEKARAKAKAKAKG
jgi:hypothetical protein